MAAGQPGWAASFDCANAETADEKVMRADRELDDADVEMAARYTQRKASSGYGRPRRYRR